MLAKIPDVDINKINSVECYTACFISPFTAAVSYKNFFSMSLQVYLNPDISFAYCLKYENTDNEIETIYFESIDKLVMYLYASKPFIDYTILESMKKSELDADLETGEILNNTESEH